MRGSRTERAADPDNGAGNIRRAIGSDNVGHGGKPGPVQPGELLGPEEPEKFKTELDKQEDRVRDMRNFMMRIINQIDGLDDGKDRALLNGYYVQGMTWGELARQMNYANVYVRGYLKAVALNHFDKKYHEFLVTYQHVTK